MKTKALLILAFLVFFQVSNAQENWTTVLPTIGTFSSPRVADLNGDGIKDIILGGGRLEFQKCDTAMFALNGKDGSLLWKVSAIDQIFGSACLYDIDKDGVLDPIMNGRSSELKAISGATGNVIWAFDTLKYSNKGKRRWFNFYNPQLIHDVDGDGLRDLLIANGGDIWVAAHDPKRAAGRLVIISSKNGSLINEAYMPDDREIYMSVSVDFQPDNPKKSKIIFGTGGETVDGNLYVGTLEMLLKDNLKSAIKLESGQGKGFIGPPVWVDITGDGKRDIVANAVNGRVLAFDGDNYKPLWSVKLPNSEAYSSLAIGNFDADSTLDFFVSFAQGVWPELHWTQQAMISGKDGNIMFQDSIGYYQTSTPVVVDVTDDGIDEVILSVDIQSIDSMLHKTFYTTLYAIEFTQKEVVEVVEGLPGHNVSSTPWLGDLDNDGMLDIIYLHGTNFEHTYTFDGLRVNCLKTTIPIKKPVKWGAYMGSDYDGVYK